MLQLCVFFLLARHSDLKHDHKCGYEGGINRTHDVSLFDSKEFNRILRVSLRCSIDFNSFDFYRLVLLHKYKRSSDGSQVRGPYNSNKRSSYVELVLVVDNKVFKSLDKNYTKVHQHCKDIANIINAVRHRLTRNANEIFIVYPFLVIRSFTSR